MEVSMVRYVSLLVICVSSGCVIAIYDLCGNTLANSVSVTVADKANQDVGKWRQDSKVLFAEFIRNGKEVITVGSNFAIQLWEFPSAKRLAVIGAPVPNDQAINRKRYFRAVALTNDGRTVATCFGERHIRVYDVTNGNQLRELDTDSMREGCSLAFSPSGEELATLLADGSIRIWDWKKAKKGLLFKGGAVGTPVLGSDAALTYSPDGKLIMSINRGLEGGTIASSVKLWNVATGKLSRTIDVGKENANSSFVPFPIFSPNGYSIAFTNKDGSITIWEIASGKERCKTKGKHAYWPIVFSPDSAKLYARAYKDGLVQEWDVATGLLSRSIGSDGEGSISYGSRPNYCTMAISPDGSILVLAAFENRPRFFDLKSGKEVGD
jgi:WD40 repeat protein